MKTSIFPHLIILVSGTPAVLSSFSPPLASRQSFECGAAPVDCGGGWCCSFAYICQAAPDNRFVCIDTILTQADGSPYTLAAWNPSSFAGGFSSVTQPLTLTFSDTTEVITSGTSTITHPLTLTFASTTAVFTPFVASSRSSSSLSITTSSLSARPSTIIPTSSSSLGMASVRLPEGWWLGVVLGIVWRLVVDF